jgi:hypothetical protein
MTQYPWAVNSYSVFKKYLATESEGLSLSSQNVNPSQFNPLLIPKTYNFSSRLNFVSSSLLQLDFPTTVYTLLINNFVIKQQKQDTFGKTQLI